MAGREKNSVRVNVNGKAYRISGEASQTDICRYAKYVDDKISELLDSGQYTVNTDFMILTSLNIAEDLFNAMKNRDEALEMAVSREEEVLELKRRIKELENRVKDMEDGNLQMTMRFE